MIRANEEWEFLYNKLKTENKILKEFETYIFSYAHKNLRTGTLGIHIAAGLVKEHREFKKELEKLRAENERLKESVEQLANFDEKEFKRQWGIRRVGMVMDHGSVNGAMCFHHWFVTPVIKALRGADEKD